MFQLNLPYPLFDFFPHQTEFQIVTFPNPICMTVFLPFLLPTFPAFLGPSQSTQAQLLLTHS